MKPSSLVYTAVAVGVTLSMAGCGGGGGGGTVVPPPPAPALIPYPTAQDSNDAAASNETTATATAVAVGVTQVNTIYPQGDVDVYAVDLTNGTRYEFSANQLCSTCDTVMRLIDTDGVTQLDTNDDYVGFDSAIQYTAMADGTYYVEVTALDPVYGLATYTLGTRVLVDLDADTWSDFHDCDDGDAAIGPLVTEIVGDSIDQSCTGFDIPVGTNADQHEIDDTPAAAVTMVPAEGTPDEAIYRDELYDPAGNLRTIDGAGAVDYLQISVPAMSAIETGLAYDNVNSGTQVTAYDAGNNPLASPNVANTTAGALTYFFKYEASNGTGTGAYVPYYYSLGSDADGDTFYSQDWDVLRDCNDSDAAINPFAAETAGDGTDSNCDGDDNT